MYYSAARRKETTPEITFLRNLICPLLWGRKREVLDDDGNPVKDIKPTCSNQGYACTKESLEAILNDPRRFTPNLSNYNLDDHFQGKQTLYFSGHHDQDHDIMLMIDIDVQKALKKGSTEGAQTFAKHLDKELSGHVFWETSTHGKGMQGFFVLECKGIDRAVVNDKLKCFETWLRQEAALTNAEIELVEIKGHCPLIAVTKGRLRSHYEVHKFGTLAKIPRDVGSLMKTAPLPIDDLPVLKEVKAKKTIVPAGSISGKAISDEELALLPDYGRKAEVLLAGEVLQAGRWTVTAEDMAIFLMLAKYYKHHPGPGKSLSVRQFGALWKCLHKAGDIDRAWNHHRFKAIRDFLSANGYIQWEEHRYITPVNAGEQHIAGKACVWEITDELYEWLEATPSTNSLSPSCVDTKPHGTGEFLVPIRFAEWNQANHDWWAWANRRVEELLAA